PAQKARPSAASTIAPTPGSAFQARIWWAISPLICAVQAFSLEGRLRRMMPTRPRVSVRICSYVVVLTSLTPRSTLRPAPTAIVRHGAAAVGYGRLAEKHTGHGPAACRPV